MDKNTVVVIYCDWLTPKGIKVRLEPFIEFAEEIDITLFHLTGVEP